MEKDLLGQDMFLIGPPGPKRRLLAMQYLELTNRELEYVALNRDTTEADLKQRREIIGGSATYFDQVGSNTMFYVKMLSLLLLLLECCSSCYQWQNFGTGRHRKGRTKCFACVE